MSSISIGSINLLAILLYTLYKYIIFPLFISPLCKIPAAHPTAPLSPLWILWKRYQAQENQTLLAAHERSGPVIRLAPDELSVNCVNDGIRTIYSGGFEKHEWYPNLFSNYDGVAVMFSTAHSTPHSHRKRMLSNVYSKSHVQSSPTFLYASRVIVFNHLLPRIMSSHGSTPRSGNPPGSIAPINARRTFESVTMDLVTAYLLGPLNRSHFLEDEDEAAEWLELYQSRKKFVFWPQEMPRLTAFFAKFGINLSPTWVSKANRKLEAWCLKHCDRAEAQLVAAEDGGDDAAKSERTPVVYAQLCSQLKREAEKSSNVPLSTAPARVQIASEIFDHVSAGHETSAITLTFLFHELSLRPSLQRRLRDELQTLEPNIVYPPAQRGPDLDTGFPPLPTPKQLDALPLLQAILMETLRLHPAIPGPQPRVTPSTPIGISLGPYHNIPGGVRVSANPLCLHQNELVFPNASSWIPERWLQGDGVTESQLQEQHRWFWAFGSGGRMCIGSNLAMAQMKLIIAAILCNFRLERVDELLGAAQEGTECSVEGVSEEKLAVEPLPCSPFEQEDAYTAQPMSSELLIRFVPW